MSNDRAPGAFVAHSGSANRGGGTTRKKEWRDEALCDASSSRFRIFRNLLLLAATTLVVHYEKRVG